MNKHETKYKSLYDKEKPPYWVTDCSYDIKFEYSYEEARTKV